MPINTILIVIIAAAVAAVVIAVVAVLLSKRGRRNDAAQEAQAKAQRERETEAALFEDEEVMPDNDDDGPTPEEQFLLGTVREIAADPARVYNGIYVPTPAGGTHVIHLLLRERTGFYLFKYLPVPTGWIVGQENARWWTHFKSPEDKNYFDNPILDLDSDIKAMTTFFPKTKRENYHAYCVISDNCELREIKTESDVKVIPLSDLPQTLKVDLEQNHTAFSKGVDTMMARVLATMKNNVGLEQRLMKLKKSMQEESEKLRKMREAEAAAANRTIIYDPKNKALFTNEAPADWRPEDRFTKSELSLRESLLIWRKRQAKREGALEQDILSDAGLDHIVTSRPQNAEQLSGVSGMNERAVATYGDAILNMVRHTPV